MARLVRLIIVLSIPALAAAQAPPGTQRQSAQTRAARSVYDEVLAAYQRGALSQHDTTVKCPRDPWPAEVQLNRDSTGTVRRFRVRLGSDDSAVETTYFYDRRGRQRFAVSKRGAVNGSSEEERIYLDSMGTIIHREVQHKAGPGYPWAAFESVVSPLTWLERPCP